MTGKMVHDLRVDIRSIRSLLTLLKGQVQWKDYKKLDRTLRDIFKLFEESRKLTVFKESLKKAGLTKKKIRFCQESTEKGKCESGQGTCRESQGTEACAKSWV